MLSLKLMFEKLGLKLMFEKLGIGDICKIRGGSQKLCIPSCISVKQA